jgi:hypothetical protein
MLGFLGLVPQRGPSSFPGIPSESCTGRLLTISPPLEKLLDPKQELLENAGVDPPDSPK